MAPPAAFTRHPALIDVAVDDGKQPGFERSYDRDAAFVESGLHPALLVLMWSFDII